MELPDGRKVDLGTVMIDVAQSMFQPSILGKKLRGIQELIYESLLYTDGDLRRELI